MALELSAKPKETTTMDALGITLQQLLTQLISFLVLFILLYILAYKPIMGMLDSRSQKIKESLEAAETARLEAASSAEKVEAEIASARIDGQKIVAEARDAASKLRDQEQERAREEVESMLERARTEIGREKVAAVEDIRKEFAGLAITAAERIVEGSLDAKAHSTLIDKVLEEGLSGRNN
jgi:F-type H+-transporting ATPase subunit b